MLPHYSFHLVLIESVLYFFAPIQTTCVLSKFVFSPDMSANNSSSCKVSSRDLLEPSRKAEASSAYCENFNSTLSILIPFMFLLFLILTDRISAHRINKYER